MKKSRFTGEQVAAAVRRAESGLAVTDTCRRLGITEVTFYRWKMRFAGRAGWRFQADAFVSEVAGG